MFNRLIKLGMVAGAVVSIWTLVDKCKTVDYKVAGHKIKHGFNKIKDKIKHNPKFQRVKS